MGNHFIVFHKHLLVVGALMLLWAACTAHEEESRFFKDSNVHVDGSFFLLDEWARNQINVTISSPSRFIDCLSKKSVSVIESFVHLLNSPRYSDILQNCQKNGRWLNSTSSSKPLVIIAPNVESEVQATIICSQESGLQVRIKSGGHDYEGLSFRAEKPFVMIDLSNLKHIDINLEEETAWVQTGVTVGELYYAISQKSDVHAFPAGVSPTVGTGGHISGGGHGTLVRKYGLSADNVIDARVADANGQILDRKSMGPDFFWALRGGGGSSFGVVLAWKLKLVRVPKKVTIFTVRRVFNASAYGLLQKWQNISHNLPQEIFTRILIQNRLQGPGREKVVQLSYQGMFLGDAIEFIRFMKKTFPEFELEINDCVGPRPMAQICKSVPCVRKECFQLSWIRSALYFADKNVNVMESFLADVKNMKTPASYYKGKSDYLNKPIPDEGLEMIRNEFLKEVTPIVILTTYGGKMSEISEDASPFPHRAGTTHNVEYLDYSKTNEEGEVGRHLAWIRNLYNKMEPYVSTSPRAAYINNKDLDLGQNKLDSFNYSDAKQWGERYFKGNFERLAKIKNMVDPKNFFRNDQSIPPLNVF